MGLILDRQVPYDNYRNLMAPGANTPCLCHETHGIHAIHKNCIPCHDPLEHRQCTGTTPSPGVSRSTPVWALCTSRARNIQCQHQCDTETRVESAGNLDYSLALTLPWSYLKAERQPALRNAPPSPMQIPGARCSKSTAKGSCATDGQVRRCGLRAGTPSASTSSPPPLPS